MHLAGIKRQAADAFLRYPTDGHNTSELSDELMVPKRGQREERTKPPKF